MEIVENILTQNPCFTAGKKIAVKGLMLHSVGCSQPSAEVFVRSWNSPGAARACVHAFIDGNTGKVYQTLPWDHRAWHCGGSGNNTHIGVEMCEPACIRYTGGSSFACTDHDVAVEVVKRTYGAAVELFAYLCETYGLDPAADGVIISHKEGHDRGLASGHGDPEHLWNGLQCGYTMDGFRRDVKAVMDARAQAASGGQAVMPAMPSMPGAQPTMAPSSMPDSQSAESFASYPESGMESQLQLAAEEPAEMNLSDKGVELIARYEGCRLEAYQCAAGVWTIGYGHTEGVKPGDTLPSQEAAKELLKKDVKKYSGYVNKYIKNGTISFPVNQNQFDALTSFCYNCGSGNLQRLVSGRDAATVAEKLLLYNKGGGKVLPGLVRRRSEERALFLS